jgi:hypothetical protein
MPGLMEQSARGQVIEVRDGMVVFNPAGTRYQMHLVAGKYAGPLHQPISAIVRVTARKVYTVPSGGNFIAPIFGQPRTLQGRVVSVDDRVMVIHAGLPVVVDLPSAETAIDLDNGQITVGSMVNVVALPQARFSTTEPGRGGPEELATDPVRKTMS